MKIIALYNVYQDAKVFERSLKSVEDIVDRIVVADGPYEMLPGDNPPQSTDGTLELAHEYADKVITREEPWRGEAPKRNVLLQEVPMFGSDETWWALLIDADEIVTSFDRDKLAEIDVHDTVLARFKYVNDSGMERKESWIHRLIRPDPAWNYCKRDRLRAGYDDIPNRPYIKADWFEIEHHPDDRPEDRQEQRREYKNHRFEKDVI